MKNNYRKNIDKLIDLYFNQKSILYNHLFDSYHQFIEEIIPYFLSKEINVFYESEINKGIIYYHGFECDNIEIRAPVFENNNEIKYPNDARKNHLTYSSMLYATVRQYVEKFDTINNTTERTIIAEKKKYLIAVLPIMVKSKYCSTCIMNNLHEECRFDPGGYFIVSGQEKVVMSIEKMVENKVLIFSKKNISSTEDLNYIAQINSRKNDWSDNLQILTIKFNKNNVLIISTSLQLVDIPVFILLRALDVESDKDIISYITYNLEDSKMIELLETSRINCDDNNGIPIKTKKQANDYLITKIKKNKRFYNDDDEAINLQKRLYLEKILKYDLLSHLGEDISKKKIFIGYMINKLLNVILKRIEPDDRDALCNKRIETPGVLLSQLFRQKWKQLLNEIGKNFKKKNSDTNEIPNVINNISSNIIEKGIKTALSLGIWGINKTKKGVAQPLQRLSWLQSISYLRRILLPSIDDSTIKITSIRHVNQKQCQLLCCVETPEGAKIGVVKSLSMMASITIQNLNEIETIKKIFSEDKLKKILKHPDDIGNILEMNNYIKIFINGDFFKICKIKHSLDVYNQLKEYRFKNLIGKFTTILYDFYNKEIRIYSDGGRLIRPLLVVNNNEIGLTEEIIKFIDKEYNLNDKIGSWNKILDTYKNLIEYEDIESLSYLLVAENIQKLEENKNNSLNKSKEKNYNIIDRYDNYRWVKYTHCDFHSWVMLGTIATNIPFSNNNYAGRNILCFSQLKQSVSIFLSSYQNRIDNTQILYNPQIPLVTTQGMKYNCCLDLPFGENVIVAIMSYNGYNQEDSIMINKSAVRRGLFRADTIKKYNSEIKKNPSTSQDDVFTKPDPSKVTNMKYGNYEKLDPFGMIKEGTVVENEDMIIGKISPINPTGNDNKTYKDNSEIFKSNINGIVDKVVENIYNSEGYKMVDVTVRIEREPIVGDKFTCYDDTHEIFTFDDGWVNVKNIKYTMKIATLTNGILSYSYPNKIHKYYNNEEIYNIENEDISLNVTLNHNMYVKTNKNFELKKSKEILNNKCEYLNKIIDYNPNLNFNCFLYTDVKNDIITHFRLFAKIYKIKNWLIIYSLFLYSTLENDKIFLKVSSKDKIEQIENICIEFNWKYEKLGIDVIIIDEYTIYRYLILNNIKEKFLPYWVFYLSKSFSKLFLDNILSLNENNIIYNEKYINLYFKLFLHSGYQCKIIDDYTIEKCEKNLYMNKEKIEDKIKKFDGYVYCVTVNGDGIVLVRRNNKYVWCGNSRMGQKGTVGLLYDQKDMPFTENGIIPDMILNPHGFPSRMAIGQFMDCIVSKYAALSCEFVDGTPFNDYDIFDVCKILKEKGFSPYGTETMYCGLTGKKIEVEIFIGPIYNIRLKHMVLDKIHARSRGPKQSLTRQPLEGRARDGGLKIGVMEKDAIVAHGATQFLKERMMECSDICKMYVCDDCGMFAHKFINHNYYICKGCENTTRISSVVMPYACKLLFQELTSVNILPRIRTEKTIYDEET